MAKRQLRVVKLTPIALGICDLCNSQFHSTRPVEDDAEADIQAQFDTHTCKPIDSSQNALRIVREAKENS